MRQHERRGGIWLVLLAVAILLAYIVPYTVLSGVEAWQGAFLFWTLFGIVAIGLIARLVAEWRS